MATPTYDLLDSVTLSSSASSVTFSSIDQSYRDLVLVVEGSSTSGFARGMGAQFNNDTGSNYNYVSMTGDGSSASSSSVSNNSSIGVFGRLAASGGKAINIIQIMDYSATDKHKSCLSRTNNAASDTNAVASRWASNSAITEIDLLPGSSLESGSTFYLYGVAA